MNPEFTKLIQGYKERTTYYSLDDFGVKSNGIQKQIALPSFVLTFNNQNQLSHFCEWVEKRENYNVGFVNFPILTAREILSKKIEGVRQKKLDIHNYSKKQFLTGFNPFLCRIRSLGESMFRYKRARV